MARVIVKVFGEHAKQVLDIIARITHLPGDATAAEKLENARQFLLSTIRVAVANALHEELHQKYQSEVEEVLSAIEVTASSS